MTDAELTILSLIAEGARYGHEIQQIIDERGLREWVTIGFSSVHYILNRLERQQLLTSEVRAEGRGPGRKLFSITDAGRGVLQTAVSDLLRQPRSLGTGFELGLANLSSLKPQQAYLALKHHQADLQQQLHLVEQSWERHQKNGEEAPPHIRALYTHSLAVMRAELAWLSQFVEDWAKRYPAVTEMPSAQKQAESAADPHSRVTQLHQRETPDRAKMLQKLKRPKPDEPE
jgi:DNA-binding PadR family transcriptional regulator